MKSTILISVVICIASSISVAQIPNIIRNGGFEKDADGDGIADQ